MTTIPIDRPDQLAEHLSKQVKSIVSRALMSSAMRLIGVIQNDLIPSEDPPPILNRHYASGWIPEPQPNGDVHIKNTMPYAAVIEWGAKAENIKIGRAMIEALTEWVITKGLVGRPKNAVQRAQAQFEARNMAWAIAQAMKNPPSGKMGGIFNRNGQNGLRIAEKAGKRAPEIVSEEIARESKKAFK